jgi:uncharacterized protein
LARRAAFEICGRRVAPGRAEEVELPIARLVTGTEMSLPVMVLHGTEPGPAIWLDAAIHGDEIGGVAVIQRVLRRLSARELRGTVLAVPIVNVHGFVTGDRYLPDRRDLNRAFPGSPRGSLAARIAHLMMSEVVARCDYGIDMHTGSDHRFNLPQVRADLDDRRTRELAVAFGAPIMIHSRTRDGSLRAAASQAGATVLLYEGGEAWRFDDGAIGIGADGVLRVLAALGMVDAEQGDGAVTPLEARRSKWVRAPVSGIVDLAVAPGHQVTERQQLGVVTDSFGRRLGRMRSPFSGVVIGQTEHPLVNRGDAVLHVAETTA